MASLPNISECSLKQQFTSATRSAIKIHICTQ